MVLDEVWRWTSEGWSMSYSTRVTIDKNVRIGGCYRLALLHAPPASRAGEKDQATYWAWLDDRLLWELWMVRPLAGSRILSMRYHVGYGMQYLCSFPRSVCHVSDLYAPSYSCPWSLSLFMHAIFFHPWPFSHFCFVSCVSTRVVLCMYGHKYVYSIQ